MIPLYSGGADAISLINTLRGMKIDIHKRKPVLANRIGGYSGPGIMPVALRMVYEVCDWHGWYFNIRRCS